MTSRPLKIILFVAFVDLVGFGLIIPLQAVYAKRLGASGLTFGLLLGAYSLMQLVFSPLLGRWSDRFGRRRVLLLSIAGSMVAHALLGVADMASSLSLLFVARIVDGITGANIATAQAYVADVTTTDNRAKGMGLFGAAFGLGFVVGPALGSALAFIGRHVSGPAHGTAWPAFGATVISLVAFLLVWLYLPEPAKAERAARTRYGTLRVSLLRAVLGNARLRELFAIVFGSVFTFVLLEVTFVYLCTHTFAVTEAGTGMIFAYIGALMIIVQGGLVGPLVHRFGEATLAATGPFITAVGFALISIVPLIGQINLAWLVLIVGCVPTSLGQGLTTPAVSALVSRQAGRRRQGATLGLSQGVAALARAIAPPVGGLLYDLGPSWPYWIGAALFVAVGILATWVRRAQHLAVNSSSPPESGEASSAHAAS